MKIARATKGFAFGGLMESLRELLIMKEVGCIMAPRKTNILYMKVEGLGIVEAKRNFEHFTEKDLGEHLAVFYLKPYFTAAEVYSGNSLMQSRQASHLLGSRMNSSRFYENGYNIFLEGVTGDHEALLMFRKIRPDRLKAFRRYFRDRDQSKPFTPSEINYYTTSIYPVWKEFENNG